MEKRIGAAIILIKDKSSTTQLNEIISRHSNIIIGRQGVPLPNKGISVITLIFEGAQTISDHLPVKSGVCKAYKSNQPH